jgi:hypothetical protein
LRKILHSYDLETYLDSENNRWMPYGGRDYSERGWMNAMGRKKCPG